jgi:succinate dehydrogenase/fumarate reductase flavoprotein subunit
VHSGAIGLAIDIGAACANLTESQFGLASIGFRWNVSGTYQQAVPRYVSVGADGDEEDFLSPFFQGSGSRDSAVFLKGYQWPFDPKKVENGGSSLVDLLVHRERVFRKRRVYMDFRRNSEGWDPAQLSSEAREYLEKSGALEPGASETPLSRLERMNPIAVEHYKRHGIDLTKDMLEIALCAQHNNGGLAADAFWESVNIDRLFPVGEVNGSHGIYRPGGAALNSGQVGAHRAARRILGAYLAEGSPSQLDGPAWKQAALDTVDGMLACIDRALRDGKDRQLAMPDGAAAIDEFNKEFMDRMDRSAGIIRSADVAAKEAAAGVAQVARFGELRIAGRREIPNLFRARHLVLAHAAYLAAVADYVAQGGGTRGSALVAGPSGRALHPVLDASWNAHGEKEALRDFIQELAWTAGRFAVAWIPRRGIPDTEDWFEKVWRDFREGRIYSRKRGS